MRKRKGRYHSKKKGRNFKRSKGKRKPLTKIGRGGRRF